MAAESNSRFRGEDKGSALNQRAISFQSGSISNLSEMVPMGNYFGLNSTSGVIYPGNSGIINSNPVISPANNSSGSSLLLDSVPGLKHDTVLAVEWSVEEQYRLEEGLANLRASHERALCCSGMLCHSRSPSLSDCTADCHVRNFLLL